jgi:hypothetical protein
VTIPSLRLPTNGDAQDAHNGSGARAAAVSGDGVAGRQPEEELGANGAGLGDESLLRVESGAAAAAGERRMQGSSGGVTAAAGERQRSGGGS